MIFRASFTGAGRPYADPHSFRKTLAQLGERLRRTPEEFKAWSQNLGHEQVLTTFSSYGQVAADRQAVLIRHLAQSGTPKAEIIDRMSQLVKSTPSSDRAHGGTAVKFLRSAGHTCPCPHS